MPPSKSPLRELPAISQTDWDNVRKVKRALRDLEAGVFTHAAQVVDAMGRDDRISGVMMMRTRGLLGLPLEMEPQGDARRAKTVAKDAQDNWPRWFPEDQLQDLASWGHFLGLGLGQSIWERSGSRWEPRLKVWHPQHVHFRWDTRTYWVATDGGGMVEVLPDDPQWVVYTPYGYERGWMKGLVRALAIPWVIRQWAWRDWSRYSEVHGLPIRMGKVPSHAGPEDKDRFIRELAALGSESNILVPQAATKDEPGFDVELLEASANTWEGFEKLLERADVCIAVAVLGQNLTTEVKGGSYAAADVHKQVRNDILRADSESLSTCLREQPLSHWARFNFGEASLAPWPRWDTEPPTDIGAEATALKTLGDAFVALQAAGARPDIDAILEKYSVPTLGPAEEPEPEEEPGPGEDDKETASRKRKRRRMSGLLRGQLYADEVGDRGRAEGTKIIGADLKSLLELVEGAESYSQLREKLTKAFRGMDAGDFASLMEKCLILAELNGRYAVHEDL